MRSDSSRGITSGTLGTNPKSSVKEQFEVTTSLTTAIFQIPTDPVIHANMKLGAQHKPAPPAPCKRYTASMIFFGMNNVNDKSTKNGFDDRMKDQIKSVKQRYLHGVIKWFICTYIIDMEMFMKHFSNIDSLQAWEAYQKSQVMYALLTPREAERVKWNRIVNNKGGVESNVFMDLGLEHDNHYFKEQLKGLGPNVNQTNVKRISNAFSVIHNLRKRLDGEMLVREILGSTQRRI
ncbi:PREDICTED: uncharacterized protein LOC107357678 [Paramuricea clavata]|uniref:PREDICTED: uncharacterized protein LOC107357678, partial n=1 Tax=Paramuricea clavata TaxID=317549 RepID=A0A7D9IF44_PARCT|nr:PREDICTED: uncharacterized protein LOC107357678 [Paramuricea clavata]